MVPHYQDNNITIHKLKCGPYDNNAYILVCPHTNESILIDTPADPGLLIETATTTDVKAILITHNHFDHIEGFTEVTSAIQAPVGIGEPDANGLPKPANFFLEDGMEIKAGGISLLAISTPGHTPGSTCLTVGKNLFTGDTLFPGGPGKTRNPKTFQQIVGSITSNLFSLSDGVTFYPGHGDDGELKTAIAEYKVFSSKECLDGLYGDVLWLSH